MGYFQGGPACLVLGASGKDPAKRYRLSTTGAIRRGFDPTTKGYVWSVDGGAATRLSLGECARSGPLGIVHDCIVFQLALPTGQRAFAVELLVADAAGNRRRALLSTAFTALSSTPLHAQIPLGSVLNESRGTWFNWRLNLAELTRRAFGHTIDFGSLDGISVGPSCKLRAIFSLRDAAVAIPSAYQLPAVLAAREASFPPAPASSSACRGTDHDAAAAPDKTSVPALSVVGKAYACSVGSSSSSRAAPRVHIAFGSRCAKLEPRSVSTTPHNNTSSPTSTRSPRHDMASNEAPRSSYNRVEQAAVAHTPQPSVNAATSVAGASLEFQATPPKRAWDQDAALALTTPALLLREARIEDPSTSLSGGGCESPVPRAEDGEGPGQSTYDAHLERVSLDEMSFSSFRLQTRASTANLA